MQIGRDGTQALALFRGSPPDAALLDIDIPGVSGYEVARQIHRTGAGRAHAVLIAVTGRTASLETSAEMFDAGFDCYVPIPWIS